MTQTEVNRQLIRPLAITAAILGIIQGVVWLVISALCLCCYFDIIDDESSLITGEYYIYINDIFLRQDDQILTNISNLIIKPFEFSVFMWFYLALSLIWFIESSAVLWAIMHNKWKFSTILFGGWIAVTTVILIIDSVFVGLIGHDYGIIQNSDDESIASQQTEILVSYGIVMSVAAKGYALWVVDLIFMIIMFKFTIDIAKYENSPPDMPIIYGYETDSVNVQWQTTLPETPWPVYPNRTFDSRNHGFERSQSFDAVDNYNPTNNNKHRYYNDGEKIATIGKYRLGQKNNLNKVLPPIIPNPDYTPPGTPLKSVLKSKSKY